MSSARGGRFLRVLFPGLLVGAIVALAGIAASAQPPDKPKPDKPDKVYRYAPTLAVLMVAYEGVLNNDETTNPKMVRHLKQFFESTPSARKTLDKIHKAYKALSTADRQRIVGKEFVNATGKTRLTKAVTEPVFSKHFKRTPPIHADKAPTKMSAELLKPMKLPDSVKQADAKNLKQDRPIQVKQRNLGNEPPVDNSTRYAIKYTGLYCRTEPADVGHCEPYVIFSITQGDRYWTRRYGPYDSIADGDAKRDEHTLRTTSFGSGDVKVTATVFEHDLGNLDDIQDAIHAALGCDDSWGEGTLDMLTEVIADVLSWFAALFGLDDDVIGGPRTIRFTKSFAERHTGHSTTHGISYDTYLRFTGGSSAPARERGDFFIYFDVVPVD